MDDLNPNPEIEFRSPEECIPDDEVIKVAKGQVPILTNYVTVYCPRCHWGLNKYEWMVFVKCEFCNDEVR